ncbi:acyltransferase family protein [Georgenia alba]|uniref:Acyltransferase family protein n=1 Tax=Georgenia alba TaxID=2233858 RepID=A0ABW2QB50_9MICO
MVTQVHEPRTRPRAATRPVRQPPRTTPRRPAKRPQPRNRRIEGLDGLRALAVTAVLVFHLRAETLPGGFLGVDVFFVVSGFLITTLLLRELATGRINLGRFWLRRARRLLPAVLAVVVVTVPVAWAVNPDLLVGIARQTVGALTFSTNWLEIGAGSSYFDTTAPQVFAHFWSLAVEEQFYLLWPVLLVLLVAATSSALTRARVAIAGAAASAVAMAVLVTPGEDATRVYYGTDTHAFSLLVGVALAFWWSQPQSFLTTATWRRWRGPAALVALAGLVGLMLTLRETMAVTFRGGILLAALLTGVLIAALLGRAGPFQALLRLPPLEWVGQRSYGIYLWHWPVVVLLTLLVPTAHDSAQHWVLRGVAVIATLALAAASYRWLETPVRTHGFAESLARFRRALGAAVPSRRAVARVAAGTTALLVVLSGVAIAVAPERTSTQAQIEDAEARMDDGAQAPAEAGREPVAPDGNADFSMPAGDEITAFGDSLVVTSADGLEYHLPGIMIDARSNRRWSEAPEVVRAMLAEGTVRRAVLLHFGTNAGVEDPDVVREVLDALGPDRMVVMLNVYGSSHWVPETNATLEEIAADYPNVHVADWNEAAAERPELLQADRVHPGIEGAHLYANVVKDAFASLSEQLTGRPVPQTPAGDG